MDTEKMAKRFLQIVFDEARSEGTSVDDVEEITQKMIAKVKAIKMLSDAQVGSV